MEMAGQDYATMFNHENGLLVEFTLSKDIKNARLRYITTGHGGWEDGGRGEADNGGGGQDAR